MPYFLDVTTIGGSSLDSAHHGSIEVDGFSFETSTAGGKPDLGPLEVTLHDEGSLTHFLAALASGEGLTSASLIGTTQSGISKGGLETYRANLGEVFVTGVQQGSDGSYVVTLDYAKIAVTTHTLQADGTLGPAQTFSYDSITGQTGEGVANTPQQSLVASAQPTNFFAVIDGMNGGSHDAAHVGWFELDGFNLEALNKIILGASSGGLGASKPDLEPITLELPSQAALTDLLNALAQNAEIDGVQIEGVTTGSKSIAVYDLDLTGVHVTEVTQSGNGGLSVTLDYSAIKLSTVGLNAQGGLSPAQTFSWNVATDTNTFPTGFNPTPSSTANGAHPGQFFLDVTTIGGSSLDALHHGSIEVDAFAFETTTSGGKPALGPLELTLHDEGSLTHFLSALASGTDLTSASLVGTTPPGVGKELELYRANLGNVFVTGVQQGSDGSYQVTLDYAKIAVTTHPLQPDGTLGPAQSFSYDSLTGQTGGTVANTPQQSGLASTQPTSFFAVIDGMNGGSHDAAHAGWFELDGFNLGALDDVVSGGGKSGLGATTPNFDPITLKLPTQAALTDFLDALATNATIDGVQIEGVTSAAKPVAVYDLSLAGAHVTSVSQSSDGGLWVTLDYSAIKLSTVGLSAQGAPGPAQTFSWNLAENTNTFPNSFSATASSAVNGAHPAQFFLDVATIGGSSLDAIHHGSIEVDSFSFDTTAAGGKPDFGPLQVMLHDEGSLTHFLNAMVSGEALSSASLVGTTLPGISKEVELYRANLGQVFVTGVEQSSDGSYIVTLDYAKISVTTHPVQADGSLGTAQTFSYDSLTGQTGGTVANTPQQSGLASTQPANFFVVIDGMNGGSHDAAHAGWFELDGFDLTALNNIVLGAGSGGLGASKPELDPITLNLPSQAALTDLLNALAKDSTINGVQIEGMSSGSSKPIAVYDLDLAGVHVTSVTQSSGGGLSVTLDYSAIKLSTVGLNAQGAPGPVQSFSWNLTTDTNTFPTGFNPTPSNGSSGGSGGGGTTAPATPTGLALAAASDSGVAGDHITNHTQVVITGSTGPNASVTLYDSDGKTVLATGSSDATGAFSLTTSALSDGQHNITAVATASGLSSSASTAVPVTVDTVAPNAPAGLADAAIVGGLVGAGGDTAAQQLTGTADAFSVVTVYDGATALGSVTADAQGGWTFTLGHLPDGLRSITATATDVAGNTSGHSSALGFTVDTLVLSPDSGPHALTETAGVTGQPGTDSVSATLAFTDGGLTDVHSVSVETPVISWSGGGGLPPGLAPALRGALTTVLADSTGSGSGSITAAFSAPDSTFDFLAQGETLTVTYEVTLTDGDGHAVSQPVAIVVTGTNDAPVLSADAGPHLLSERVGVSGAPDADSASTTLAFTDADLTDTHSVSVAVAGVTWSGGAAPPASLGDLSGALTTALADSTASGAGSVTATFSAVDSRFDFLARGETLTVTYNVTVTDSLGVASTRPVTFTVVGTDDAPVISGPLSAVVVEDAALAHIDALAHATDIDVNDHLTAVGVPSNLPPGVSYDAASHSFVVDPSNAAFQHLAAGEAQVIVVTYGVGDGTMVVPTQVSITINGTNDAPVVSGAVVAAVSEDGQASINALANASDIDDGAHLSVVAPTGLPPGVTFDTTTQTFSIDASNAAYQHLAAGATQVVTVSYGVSDGLVTTPATASFTVTGTNDAPVVSGAVAGTAVEDGAVARLDALAKATDVDDNTMLSVVGLPAALPAGVTYDATTHTFALDPANSAYQHLGAGQSTVVSVTYGVSDGSLTTAATASWTVTGVNDAPVAVADAGAVDEKASVTLNVLGNDTDVDDLDTKSIVSVGPTALGGVVTIDGDHLVYSASDDTFSLLNLGQSVVDTFTYTIKDSQGATSTATVSVRVNGVADGADIVGGNKSQSLVGTALDEHLRSGNGGDSLNGGGGSDTLDGGNGKDVLQGGSGIDKLSGANGADVLNGGLGNDTLTGGNGADRFVFDAHFGKDVITDFSNGDTLEFAHGLFANYADLLAHAHQVGLDVVITLDGANSITLLGVSLGSLSSGSFLFD